MESSCITHQNKFPVDPYAGGRFLKAITASKNFNPYEKLLLLTIGADLDFRDIQGSQRYISNEHLSERTSISIRHIKRLTTKLAKDGYLVKTDRFDENKRQKSNLYSLAPKVFEEYLEMGGEGDCQARGRVTDSPPNLPNKELPTEKPISKDIGKKSRKQNKNGELKKVVGYLGAMFKPDGSPETRGFPWVNKEQLEAVAEPLLDEFKLEDIKSWYRLYVDRGLLGKMRWIPSQIVTEIRRFCGQKDGGTLDQTNSATTQNDIIVITNDFWDFPIEEPLT